MSFEDFMKIKYLPILCFVWLVATFIISYGVAAGVGHVYPVWPYISDTGTLPPESCIFGLMLNIGAMFMAMVLFVRYKQLHLELKVGHEKWHKILHVLNIFCLVTGMVASLGVAIVANFQETSNLTVHLIGANMCFGVGTGYFIVHTVLAFMINKELMLLNIARSLLCIVYVISFALTMIYAKISLSKHKVSTRNALEWEPKDPGYNDRLISTFSEWILGLCLGLYILTFYNEFRSIHFNGKFILHEKLSTKRNNLHV